MRAKVIGFLLYEAIFIFSGIIWGFALAIFLLPNGLMW